MMALSQAALDMLDADNVVVVHLVLLALDSGDLRLNSSALDLEYGGFTWIGRGNVASIGVVKNMETGEATGQNFSLSSIPSAFVSMALSEPLQGRAVTQYLALLDETSHQIALALEVYNGYLDKPTIIDGKQTATINVSSESKSIMQTRSKVPTYSDAEQRAIYPDDGSMRFVTSAASEQLVWPARGWFAKNL